MYEGTTRTICWGSHEGRAERNALARVDVYLCGQILESRGQTSVTRENSALSWICEVAVERAMWGDVRRCERSAQTLATCRRLIRREEVGRPNQFSIVKVPTMPSPSNVCNEQKKR